MDGKIKITMYFDVYPSQTDFNYMVASATPGVKPDGYTRYGFDIWVDNPMQVDEFVKPVNITKVDEDLH